MDEEEHAEAHDQDFQRQDEAPVADPIEDPAPHERSHEHDRAQSSGVARFQ
jgi:hypothetical protein